MRDRILSLFSFQFDIAFNLLFNSTFFRILSICKAHHIKWTIISENIVSVCLIYVENVTYTFNLGHFREKQEAWYFPQLYTFLDTIWQDPHFLKRLHTTVHNVNPRSWQIAPSKSASSLNVIFNRNISSNCLE